MIVYHDPYPGGAGNRVALMKAFTFTGGTGLSISFRVTRLWLPAGVAAAIVLFAATGCAGESSGERSSDEQFPITITAERAGSGAALYATNCASCHGEPGVSRPILPNTPPHDGSGHTWHHPDRLLFGWVLDRGPLAVTMPAFRGVLDEEEVIAILAYIKSTWPEDIRQFQREGSEQYELQLRESP